MKSALFRLLSDVIGFLAAFAIVFFACFQAVRAEVVDTTITFKWNGELIKKFEQRELKDFVAPETIRFLEPHELISKEMSAIHFQKLLNAVYGKRWTNAKKLEFTCRDGYRPTLSRAAIETSAYLAFAETGREDFQIKKGETIVDLRPYYLIWKHSLRDEKLQIHLNQGHWPYQLVGVDLKL